MEEMQNLGILDNQYILISLKSEDAFNFYYAARDNQNQNDFIIEIRTNQINKDNNKKINNIPANDFNILNTLNNANSPYILHYIRNRNGPLVLKNQPPINVDYTIFENASKFNLGNYLNKEGFSERHSKLIFKKILTGVQAIHNSNICQRNISPWHIMFDNEKEAQKKARKFGLELSVMGVDVEVVDAYSDYDVNDGAELSENQVKEIKRELGL